MNPDIIIGIALTAEFVVPVGLAVRAHRKHLDAVAEEVAERDPHVRWARDLKTQHVAAARGA